MGVILTILALIVGYIIVSAVLKANMRMHYANEQRAFRDAEGNLQALPPSWATNRDKVEIFFNGVLRLADRRGIPISYSTMLLSQKEFGRYALGIIGAVERQGSSFTEQQMTGVEIVQTAWTRLPDEEKAKLKALQDSGLVPPADWVS